MSHFSRRTIDSMSTNTPTHSSRSSSHKKHPSGHLPTPISADSDLSASTGVKHTSFSVHSAATTQTPLSDTMDSPYNQRRSLPPLTFSSDQAFEDAYVQFILYCNPAIPQDVNTHDLRKNFTSPPRSDSKTFSTRRLFELLQQLDRKELKTWTELALKLGVEKPSIEKGQSSQKVQQYSVRLKRWLRASHIDAFFDYMMGKSHSYLELPPPHDPFPEQRDGVFAEDDLALRALKPEFRPKRGRKRAESDDVEPMSAIEPKRPHLDPAFSDSAYPHSAYPSSLSAHPENAERFQHEQWPTPATGGPLSAVPQTSPGQVRWRLNDTPSTPYPPSASPSTGQFPDSAVDDESMSQSQKMKMRRRHGTAVSSAWPSNSTTPNGKLRGRPPTNRSVKDGPFISFPANPYAKEGPAVELSRSLASTPVDGPQEAPQHESPFRVPAYPTPISATNKQQQPGRPERLSVTVPEHTGNPVRLVTPNLTINGATGKTATVSATTAHSTGTDDLKRALVADLLKADLVGRAKPLRGSEAVELADILLAYVILQAGWTDDIDKFTLASWLGLNPPTSTQDRWTSVSNKSSKKITVHRMRVSADGYDIPLENNQEGDAVPGIKRKFDVEWDLSLGGISGKFEMKGLPMCEKAKKDSAASLAARSGNPNTGAGSGLRGAPEEAAEANMTWEQRYKLLEERWQQSNEQIRVLKDRVLNAVL